MRFALSLALFLHMQRALLGASEPESQLDDLTETLSRYRAVAHTPPMAIEGGVSGHRSTPRVEDRLDGNFNWCEFDDRIKCLASWTLAGHEVGGAAYQQTWLTGCLFEPDFFLEYSTRESPPARIFVGSTDHWRRDSMLGNPLWGGPLNGRVQCQAGQTLLQILSTWESVQIVSTEELVGELRCVVVEASGQDGLLRVWLAPTLGYHVVQYVLEKNSTNRFYRHVTPQEPPLHDSFVPPESLREELRDVRFESFEGELIPRAGTHSLDVTFRDGGAWRQETRMERRKIVRASQGTMDAIELGIPNGTEVMRWSERANPIAEEWRDGAVSLRIDQQALGRIHAATAGSQGQLQAQHSVASAPLLRPWLVRLALVVFCVFLAAMVLLVAWRRERRSRV